MSYKTIEKDGQKLSICFRDFREDDAPQVVDCIRNEYGNTYLKQDYYSPDVLALEQRTGRCKFLVADADGEIAGVLGMKLHLPRESMCEWITGIVLKKYRHYGIMKELFAMAAEEMKTMPGISSAYGFSVTYHDISQRSMGRLGFHPCGFLLSALSIQNISHSYAKDGNTKHHHIIIVCKMGREDAGLVHVPAEHEAIARSIYRTLGVKLRVDTRPAALSGKSACYEENDEGQKNCTLWIEESGEDLAQCVRSIEAKHSHPLQTFNAFLNISDKKAVAAYETLKSLGYFFAGWRPISTSHEIMVMHHPKNVPIEFDTLSLTEEGARLRDYVKKYYEERKIPK